MGAGYILPIEVVVDQIFGTGYTISERELRIFYELGSQKNVKIISFQRLAILFQKGNLDYFMKSKVAVGAG